MQEPNKFVHIKYSGIAEPTDSDISETPSAYIGICVDNNPNSPSTASYYQWWNLQDIDYSFDELLITEAGMDILSCEKVADMIINCARRNGYRQAIIFANYVKRSLFANCIGKQIHCLKDWTEASAQNNVDVKHITYNRITFTNGSVIEMLDCIDCARSSSVNERIVVDNRVYDTWEIIAAKWPDIVAYRDPVIYDDNACAEATSEELQDPLDVFLGSFNVYDG